MPLRRWQAVEGGICLMGSRGGTYRARGEGTYVHTTPQVSPDLSVESVSV